MIDPRTLEDFIAQLGPGARRWLMTYIAGCAFDPETSLEYHLSYTGGESTDWERVCHKRAVAAVEGDREFGGLVDTIQCDRLLGHNVPSMNGAAVVGPSAKKEAPDAK